MTANQDAPGARTDSKHELLSGMDRRRFLRTLGNAAFGAGIAEVLAPEEFFATGNEVEVVYGMVRADDPWTVEPRTKMVPKAWYNELQRALDIQEILVDAGFPGLLGAFVTPGDYRDPEASLSLDAAEGADLSRIEELLTDFRYTLRTFRSSPPNWEETVALPKPQRAEIPDEGRIPGGVQCSARKFAGSLAPAMYDPIRERRFFATSNHLYGSQGDLRTEHHGAPLTLIHAGGRATIGHVARGYPDDDLVKVNHVDEFTPSSRIHDATPSRVVGQFTRVGLADLYARDEPLEKIGAYSGHTTGHIKGINGVTCYYGSICKRGQLKWGDTFTITDGDSGSVSYHPDPENPDDELLVAGFNNARTWWPNGDFTWGTAAHHIRRTLGFHF